MNEVTKFNFESIDVRTVTQNGETWFVAADLAKVLDLSNTTVALNRLEDDERSKFNLGRQGEANIVSEAGLYNFIGASRKAEAKKFMRWVNHEVLPSIRQTGSYSISTDPLSILKTTYDALKLQEAKQNKLEERFDNFEDAQEIRSWEQQELLNLRRNRVFAILGDKYTKAYKELSSEVFQAISKEFKRQFNVPRYNALPRKKFDEAKKFFNNWEPNNLLELAICGASQETA
ncbi:ORF6C domain-containing protein [Convivina praedatoris]|uniref:ORF6C domain-containing protein n=1 Tax=Convivina praedatoris TaxID=2880963 RepID=UPI00200D2558|nr:ORF6C domain-containing protein [Convivina sp. LMG 32447]CAH1855794.1 hypothetical protein R078138_01212 [Convivina sp. LMG 32447]